MRRSCKALAERYKFLLSSECRERTHTHLRATRKGKRPKRFTPHLLFKLMCKHLKQFLIQYLVLIFNFVHDTSFVSWDPVLYSSIFCIGKISFHVISQQNWSASRIELESSGFLPKWQHSQRSPWSAVQRVLSDPWLLTRELAQAAVSPSLAKITPTSTGTNQAAGTSANQTPSDTQSSF